MQYIIVIGFGYEEIWKLPKNKELVTIIIPKFDWHIRIDWMPPAIWRIRIWTGNSRKFTYSTSRHQKYADSTISRLNSTKTTHANHQLPSKWKGKRPINVPNIPRRSAKHSTLQTYNFLRYYASEPPHQQRLGKWTIYEFEESTTKQQMEFHHIPSTLYALWHISQNSRTSFSGKLNRLQNHIQLAIRNHIIFF